MSEKIVLITGTTSGIGKELVKIYLSKNFKVISINKVGSKINNNNIKNYYNYNIDITSSVEVFDLLENLKTKNILPNIFIFNAGINKIDLDKNFNLENFEEMIRINFYSTTIFCNFIHKENITNITILFISSFSTIYQTNNYSFGYGFSKLLINNYVKNLQKNFSSNTYKLLLLGPVNTGIKRYFYKESSYKKILFSIVSKSSEVTSIKIYNFSLNKKLYLKYPFYLYILFRLLRIFSTFLPKL